MAAYEIINLEDYIQIDIFVLSHNLHYLLQWNLPVLDGIS